MVFQEEGNLSKKGKLLLECLSSKRQIIVSIDRLWKKEPVHIADKQLN